MKRCQSIFLRRSLVTKSLTGSNNNSTSAAQRMANHFHCHQTTSYAVQMQNIQYYNFSTKTKPEEAQQESEVQATIDIDIETKSQSAQSPSILTSLPTSYTPGQAWSALQIHLAGKQKIRLEDLKDLCRSARSSTPKDAKIIRTAMLDLKRCNDFRMSVDCAQLALDGMIRSLTKGDEEETDASFLIQAGVFAGEAFVNPSTGLYVAAEARVVHDAILATLLSGVESLESVDDDDDDDDDDEEGVTPLASAANVAKGVIDTLLLRASNPTKDMKKRKKRKYLKYLRDSSGPTPDMIDVAVKICLKHDDEEEGIGLARGILEAYAERAYLGTALEGTVGLVKDLEEKLAAAAAQEAAEVEEDDDGETEEEEK